ncbi:restriction endonuclease subunit S [Aeromonas rivipollensis]|uniref:restriction endonuclease subunit S n=1 Tax=Aeromonas rivipollensis TaxID=948519 RepID=UPI003CFE4E9A
MFPVDNNGWVRIRVGDILELKYGKALPEKIRDGSGYPVYGSNGIVGFHSDCLVKSQGIIIGRKGSYGVVNLSNTAFSPIDTTYYIDDLSGLPIKFWFYLFSYLPLKELNRSTAIPGLNREDAYAQNLGLPPLAEQKEIADRLDKILAKVEATQTHLARIPEIINNFCQSVLSSAVSGKLTVDWREKNKHLHWETLSLETIAKIIDPHPSHRTPKEVDGGIPYVGIGDIKSDGQVDFENARKVSKEVLFDHQNRYTIKEGDFIFGKIGTLGNATILPIDKEYTLSANVILIQPISDKVIAAYIKHYLTSPAAMNDISQQSNSTSQAAFGIKKMRAFQAIMPSLEEQTEIVRRVEQLFAYADTIEQQAKAAKARVDKLTQAILAKAFRGELTADWRAANPDLISGDNSAAALLARIQAERAAVKPRKSRRV